MLIKTGKIIVFLIVTLLTAWTLDAGFCWLYHYPAKAFFDQLIFAISPDELAERLFHVALVAGCLLAAYQFFSWRRRTRETLWEGERLIDTVFEGIQESLIIKDSDYNIKRVNPVATQWYAHATPLVGQKCYQALRGRQHPCEVCPTRQALETRQAACQVVPKMGAGGVEQGWLEVCSYPLFDRKTGNCTGVIEFARDISTRKQAEEELKRERDFSAAVLDNISALVVVLDPQGRILRFNRACEATTGYTLEEFKGRFFWDLLLAPSEREAVQKEFQEGLTPGSSPEQENFWIAKTEGRRLVNWSKTMLLNHAGALEYIICTGMDVTQRRQAEEALRESEARYRLLLNQLPALVIKGYPDWSIDCFDRKIEALTGYSVEDFSSRRVKWCDVIHPEDLEYATQVYIEALKTTKSYVREHRIKTKSGETRWVQCRGQILCDEQGKVDYISGMTFDITAQKQAEQEVERLASFLQLNPDPLIEVDSAGNITWFNAAASRTMEKLGFPGSERLFLPIDMGEILKVAKEQGERDFYREVSINDAVFEEKIEFVAQYDVARVRAFDITMRKRTEEALKKSQASLAEAQRLAHLGNWEWDFLTGEVHWSDEVYRILGCAPQEIPATFKAFLNRVHPDDRGQLRQTLRKSLRQGTPYTIGHGIVRPDGSERSVYGQGEVYCDAQGQPARMLGTILDVTKQRRAQQALKDSERRYRLLAENFTDVIWIIDLDLRLGYVSPSIQSLTGFSFAEYKLLSVECMMRPASAELARNRLREELALEKGKADPARPIILELELCRKDGSTVWTEVKASFLRDAQGRPKGVLGVTRDITQRRKLEEQLQQAQKMEVVGRLAGGVAHDFNNLLTAILGYCELLLDTLPAAGPTHQDVGEIKKAGEQAALLTRQLLAFSRRQVLQPKSLHLNRVVENLGKMLKRVIGEDIELSIVPGANLGRVMADPGQIEQVILNLAVNARDAMPQGGRLTIETAKVDLDEAYAGLHVQVQPGNYVLLSVTDTGCGMDAETRTHIFEPFFTTKELGKGTGLGLSMVYGIVRQSGGHIWVYSEPGQGTTFKIYLPRVEVQVPSSQGVQAPEVSCDGGETILLVEDEDLVRQIARRILQKHGYTILEARDGNEALHLLEEHQGPVDLMLTDLVMPGLGGLELARRLITRRPNLKVLFMSGYAENGIADKAPSGQELAYIQKPFAAQVLAREVRKVLDASLPDLPRQAPQILS